MSPNIPTGEGREAGLVVGPGMFVQVLNWAVRVYAEACWG